MTTDLTIASSSEVSTSDLLANLTQFAASNKIGTHRFLSFKGDTGDYKTQDSERNDIVVKLGTEYLLNTPEIYHGWLCWKDGKPVDQVFVQLVRQPNLPAVDTLPDHGPYNEDEREGWRESIAFPLRSNDDAIDYIFQVSSLSAVNAMKRFIGKLLQNANAGHNLAHEVPVVALAKSSYTGTKGKAKGKVIPLPDLKLVAWKSKADLSPPLTISARPTKDTDAAVPGVNGKTVLIGSATEV